MTYVGLTEEDANLYARMNWKDKMFSPEPQAREDRERGLHPYKEMDDAEFEALWYRMSKEEFF